MRVIDEKVFEQGLLNIQDNNELQLLYLVGLVIPVDEDGWANLADDSIYHGEIMMVHIGIAHADAKLTILSKRRLIAIERLSGGIKLRWNYIIPHAPAEKLVEGELEALRDLASATELMIANYRAKALVAKFSMVDDHMSKLEDAFRHWRGLISHVTGRLEGSES